MTTYITVYTSTKDRTEANKISEVLIEAKLAACVWTMPITSTFNWNGKRLVNREWALLIKTRRSLFGRVEHVIKQHHSYIVPEIIATDIVEGSKEYLGWLEDSLHKN